MTEPVHFVMEEAVFDTSLLPPDAGVPPTPGFREAVVEYFRKAYASLGGMVDVDFRDGTIAVTWWASNADQDPIAGIISLLQAGRYADARPILETLLRVQPENHDLLYNLGMVYSDEGRLEEARQLLRRATELVPDHANSHVALAVAALRAGDTDEAEPALRRAVRLEPSNPFALRTLGTLRLMRSDAAGAIDFLRRAVAAAPSDAIALLILAQALIEGDIDAHSDEADALLKQVLAISPHGEIAEKAHDARRRLAEREFRDASGSGLRMDAVMYCLSALETFEGMTRAQLAPILMELAALGQTGLPVNDPRRRFRLRSLPGEFTALQLVCLMHAGMKQLDSSQGSGFDIEQEYEAAAAMRRVNTGS